MTVERRHTDQARAGGDESNDRKPPEHGDDPHRTRAPDPHACAGMRKSVQNEENANCATHRGCGLWVVGCGARARARPIVELITIFVIPFESLASGWIIVSGGPCSFVRDCPAQITAFTD